MALRNIKKYIQYGFITEARQLIEQTDIFNILKDEFNEKYNRTSNEKTLPLLIMCTLINNENSAYNLCVSLIEKGYKVNFRDINGLCALNYAVIFERIKLVELFLKCFDCNLDSLNDCYNNSLLHYVYAINNEYIISLVTDIYKKYYDLNGNLLSNVKNCDGLSILDLINYNDKLKMKPKISKHTGLLSSKLVTEKAHKLNDRSTTNFVSVTSSNAFTFLMSTETFFRNSNPIFIIKHIKQMYNTKLTMKTIAITDKNTNKIYTLKNDDNNQNFNSKRSNNNDQLKCFKTDYLYKIKLLKRVKSSITTPLKPNYKNDKSNKNIIETERNQITDDIYQVCLMKKRSIRNFDFLCPEIVESTRIPKKEYWKKDIAILLNDYADLSTSSFRNSVTLSRSNTASFDPNNTTSFSSNNNETIINNKINKLSDENYTSLNTIRSNAHSQNENKQKSQQIISDSINDKNKYGNLRPITGIPRIKS